MTGNELFGELAEQAKPHVAMASHARSRQWRLYQFTVPSLIKVKAVLALFARANNILQSHRLLHARV